MGSEAIKDALAKFAIEGTLVECLPYGTGHIHDTYAATYDHAGLRRRYIHQRLNHFVFKDPPGMMQNIVQICAHLQNKLQGSGDETERQMLTIIPTLDNDVLYQDSEGYFWRTYIFIENTVYYDVVEDCKQAEAASVAFARFQALLADLESAVLNETIPDFHNTPMRFEAFEAALAADSCGRAGSCAAEFDFAKPRKAMTATVTDALAKGEIPLRVTHNDTKINNVLLDRDSGEGICVIDLDTVMPGSVLYDFGDLVRTSTGHFAENEKDLSKVFVDCEFFEAIVRGYMSQAKSFLVPREVELLPMAGTLITFESGLRFLTDYLNGDTYYKISYPDENLDRCRTQFRFVQDLETRASELEDIIRLYN
jgi:hypothetical protein